MPVLTEDENAIANAEIKTIASKWLKAEPLSSLNAFEGFEDVITDLFTFKLPWVFNGIAKKLRAKDLEDDAEIIEELSMLIEIGVPNLKALKIYQAGIRSRVSANELSQYFEDELWDKSIRDYKSDIVLNREHYQSLVSPTCKEWIELLFHLTNTKLQTVDSIPSFEFKGVHKKTLTLIAKEINGKQHLVSPDYSYIKEITGSDVDFSSVNKISGIFFQYNNEANLWKMVIENPYVQIN